MFVNVMFRGVSDTETIESLIAVSEPLQRLVQKHNRIAFTNNNIDNITKDFTGAQLKAELEKHDPETLIGLLNEYISVTKIVINSESSEKKNVEVEIEQRKDAPNHPEEIIVVEKKYTEFDNDGLRSTDKKHLKVYLIKTAINLCAAAALMLLGTVSYISWTSKKLPDTEIFDVLFKTSSEIIKFLILSPK